MFRDGGGGTGDGSAIGRRGAREAGEAGRAVFPLDRPLVSGVCGSRRVFAEIFQSGPNRRAWWGDAGLSGRSPRPWRVRTRRGGRCSAWKPAFGEGRRGQRGAGFARERPRISLGSGGRTTVEDRRAVGSRAVARAAAREGSDGPRRGEHETGVQTRVTAVTPRPRGRHVARSARQAAPPSGSLAEEPRGERERARGGEKEWEESAARGCAPWRLPWSEGPGGWRRLGWAPRPWRSWRPTSYDVQRQAAEGARMSGLIKGWPGRLRRRTKIYGGNLTDPAIGV